MSLEAEKKRLIERIYYRRSQAIITLGVNLILNWSFSRALEFYKADNPTSFLNLSKTERQKLIEETEKFITENCKGKHGFDLHSVCSEKKVLAFGRNIDLNIPFMLAQRYLAYHMILMEPQWIIDAMSNAPLYSYKYLFSRFFPPLIPTRHSIKELEAIDQREFRLATLLPPLLLITLFALEKITGIELPTRVYLMLFAQAFFSIKECYSAVLYKNDSVFIENKKFDLDTSPAFFFKVPRTFTKKAENHTMVDLMLNGKLNPERKGHGFFARSKDQKGYDLKARLPDGQRAYFTKEVDHDETVYHLMANKPPKP